MRCSTGTSRNKEERMATSATLPDKSPRVRPVRALDEEPELNKRYICDCRCKCRIAHLRVGICALCEREDHWWSFRQYLDTVGQNTWTHHLVTKGRRKT
jgi:hypothetical protein